jgi:hypothetical protein
MPHCAPGKRLVTAAAIRCAVLCRTSGSASGLLLVTMRTVASCWSGYERSTIWSFTTAASAPSSRRGEIAAAMSRTGVPADTARLDPSGSVMVTWLMKGAICSMLCAGACQPTFATTPLRWATFAWLANRSSRAWMQA